ncbi:Ig-like domain-containing protein [Orbus wheelerorum]|uniref:BapA/Bap/LapF family prefix-like domain-containing protein n=1 Tax=Orbus wheelerorum TaxID=3074111 RepID=UPI00370D7483
MAKFYVIDKNTGIKVVKEDSSFYLEGSKVVTLETERNNIFSMSQDGNQLVIKLKSGEIISIKDFFQLHDGQPNSLVINDITPEGGGYWLVENPSTGDEWSQLSDLSSTMNKPDSAGAIDPWMYLLGAGLSLGAIGGVVAANSGSGASAESNQITTPKILTNNKAGITGTGTAGSEVVLVKSDGTTEVAVVGRDGKWSFTYGGNPLDNGEQATIYARDPKNHDKKTEELTTVADTEVNSPIIDVNNDTGLIGQSEAHAVITLTKADQSTLTTVADGNGNWSFIPNSLENGEKGSLIATDMAGNVSTPSLSTANIISTQTEHLTEGIAEFSSMDVSAQNLHLNQIDLTNSRSVNQPEHLNTDKALTSVASDFNDNIMSQHIEKRVDDSNQQHDLVNLEIQSSQISMPDELSRLQLVTQYHIVQEHSDMISNQMHDLLSISQALYPQIATVLSAENSDSNANTLNLSELLTINNHHLFYVDEMSYEMQDIDLEEPIIQVDVDGENGTITNHDSQDIDYGITNVVVIKEAGSDLLEMLLISQHNF